MKRRIVAFGLAMLMAFPTAVFAGEGAVRKTDFFKNRMHSKIMFEDMEREIREVRSIDSDMTLLRNLAKKEEKSQEVKETYKELLKEYEAIQGAVTLSEIEFYKDPENEDLYVEYRDFWEDWYEVDKLLGELTKDLLKSPCKEVIREVLSDADEEYYKFYDGDDRDILFKGPGFSMDYFAYEQFLVTGYLFELEDYKTSRFKQSLARHKYMNLWETRQIMARSEKNDNYAEYAYEVIYKRDYEPDELSSYFKEVKQYFCPLRDELHTLLDESRNNKVYDGNYKGERGLDLAERCFERMSGELLESLEYMRKYDLYDIGFEKRKIATAFTTNIEGYDAPFFFMQPEETIHDFFTIIHEMGHYNDAYWVELPAVHAAEGGDVKEVHSQALEMLTTGCYKELFGDDAEYVLLEQLTRIVDTICYGAMIGEFENAIYNKSSMDEDKINEQYCRLMIEYGYAEEGTYPNEMTDWVLIPQLFTEPCSYIGKSVAAVAALEFWLDSQEDYYGTIDRYLEFVSIDFVPFQQALKNVGISSPFDQYELRYLVNDIRAKVNGGEILQDTYYDDQNDVNDNDESREQNLNIFELVVDVVDNTLVIPPMHLILNMCTEEMEKRIESFLN